MTTVENDKLVRDFLEAFNTKDADNLAPFLHEDATFLNYGEGEVEGRDQIVQVWKGVFGNFERVEFETVNQAVNGDVVLAEQVHGLSLPGGPLAPIVSLAVYEIVDGTIKVWRDYSNPGYARKLLGLTQD